MILSTERIQFATKLKREVSNGLKYRLNEKKCHIFKSMITVERYNQLTIKQTVVVANGSSRN